MNGKSRASALFSVIAIAAIATSILLAPQMGNATEPENTSLTKRHNRPRECNDGS